MGEGYKLESSLGCLDSEFEACLGYKVRLCLKIV